MRKALYLQYTVGVLFYYGVTVMGYWAYGTMVSAYLPENLSGPKWINVLINAIVFLQSIVSQHVCKIFYMCFMSSLKEYAVFRWLIILTLSTMRKNIYNKLKGVLLFFF